MSPKHGPPPAPEPTQMQQPAVPLVEQPLVHEVVAGRDAWSLQHQPQHQVAVSNGTPPAVLNALLATHASAASSSAPWEDTGRIDSALLQEELPLAHDMSSPQAPMSSQSAPIRAAVRSAHAVSPSGRGGVPTAGQAGQASGEQPSAAEQHASLAAAGASLPPWLEWQRFLVEHPDASSPPPPGGSSRVPVGTVAAPSSGASPAESTGRRRALLIGVSYVGTPAELRHSIADVTRVREVLERVGFSPEDTLCLTDNQADPTYLPTHRNIIAGMRWLVHGAAPGDAFFFHFSGHGGEQHDPDAGHDEALDDALVPVDVQQAGQVTDNQVYELLVRPLPAGCRLTAIVDCSVPCSCLELPYVCDPSRGWVEDPTPHHVECDAVCFSAAPDEELTADELQTLQGRPGLITSGFLDALHQIAARRQGPATFLELLAQVREQIGRAGFCRQPVLSASQAFDPTRRHFRFFDPVPNGNAELGLRAPRLHRSLR